MLSVLARRRAIYPLHEFLSLPARPTVSQYIVPWHSRRIRMYVPLVRRPHPHLYLPRSLSLAGPRHFRTYPESAFHLKPLFVAPAAPRILRHCCRFSRYPQCKPVCPPLAVSGFRLPPPGPKVLEGIPDPAPRDDAESPTHRSPVKRRLLPSSGAIHTIRDDTTHPRRRVYSTETTYARRRLSARITEASNDVAPRTPRQKERCSSRGGRGAAPWVASADVRSISGL
jgi:hypothetical protein